MRIQSADRAAFNQLLGLWVVISLALLMRLWGVQYGLPFSYWTDEYHELMRAMQLGAGSFNLARSTKGGFYLLLFFEYGIYYAVLRIAGIVASTREFAELFARDPTAFYLIGRTTAALLGTITVAAVYWLSRLAFSTIAGLVAAIILAVNVLHVDLSHRIGVDVPMTMLATIALCFAIRVAADGHRRDYLLAALFTALATTTKLPGILLLLPLLIAHTYAVSGHGGVRAWIGSRSLWLAATVFSGVLLVTNPGIVFYTGFSDHAPTLSDGVTDESADETSDEVPPDNYSGATPNLYLFYLNALLESMGWPLFTISLVGLAYAAWRKTRADVMLVSYALINYLVIASTSSERLYYPRYALPIVVVFAVLTGRLFGGLIHVLPRWRTLTAAAAIALVVAWPVSEAITANYALTRTDTRTAAKIWFEENVPAGAKVVIEGSKIAPKRETVPLRDSRASLKRRIAYWRNVEPRQAKFLEYKLAAHEGGGYELELIWVQSVASLDEFAADQVEYFVVRPQYFIASRKADTSAAMLLEALRSDPRAKLIKRIEPESRTQPGPIIEIYRLQQQYETPSN